MEKPLKLFATNDKWRDVMRIQELTHDDLMIVSGGEGASGGAASTSTGPSGGVEVSCPNGIKSWSIGPDLSTVTVVCN